MQINKEKQCMNMLQSHFANAIVKLEEEVNGLNSERNKLLTKLGSNKKKDNGKH